MPVESSYGTANQTITMTITALASSATAGRESTVVSNATPLSLDALVQVTAVVSTGTIANDRGVHVYAYASVDDGSTFPDGITGSDAAYSFNAAATSNLAYLGFIQIPAQSLTRRKIFSIASAFGGVLPARWGIAVLNYSGISLTTGSGAIYQLVEATVT